MDMNQNNRQVQYEFEKLAPRESNTMATAAVVMGVLTIAATIMCTVYVPFITGGLAILFAILSKGGKAHMNGSAKTAVTTGVIGLSMNILLIAIVWIMYQTVPEIHDQANDLFEQRYGFTIDDMLEELSQ